MELQSLSQEWNLSWHSWDSMEGVACSVGCGCIGVVSVVVWQQWLQGENGLGVEVSAEECVPWEVSCILREIWRAW